MAPTRTRAPAPNVKAPDEGPLDLRKPRPNDGEQLTVQVKGVGTEWRVYSCPVEHRVTRTDKDGERQIVEYPWDDWVGAARYVVSVVNVELRQAGRAPAVSPIYCGSCHERVTRDADGVAVCPVHGRAGG
jgi:hypothetical protein